MGISTWSSSISGIGTSCCCTVWAGWFSWQQSNSSNYSDSINGKEQLKVHLHLAPMQISMDSTQREGILVLSKINILFTKHVNRQMISLMSYRMGLLAMTLKNGSFSLVMFAMMFFIVFFAYAQFFYFIYHTDLQNFYTVVASAETCMQVRESDRHPWFPFSYPAWFLLPCKTMQRNRNKDILVENSLPTRFLFGLIRKMSTERLTPVWSNVRQATDAITASFTHTANAAIFVGGTFDHSLIDTLTDLMGLQHIFPSVSITIGTVLNFNGDFLRHDDGDVICKQTLSENTRWKSHCLITFR